MRLAAATLSLLALVACGQKTDTSASIPAEIDMCAVMPLADVQAASPFQTALTSSMPGIRPGICEYRSTDDAEVVHVLLVATPFADRTAALVYLDRQRDEAFHVGIHTPDVPALGDAAFSMGSDEVGVHAAIGSWVIDANMGGEWPDTTDDAKIAAGTELIKTISSRLP